MNDMFLFEMISIVCSLLYLLYEFLLVDGIPADVRLSCVTFTELLASGSFHYRKGVASSQTALWMEWNSTRAC